MLDCSRVPLKDKGCHLIAGFVITLVGGLLVSSAALGILAGVFAGITKEAYDRYDYGKADFFDLFATLIGTFIGGALVVILT